MPIFRAELEKAGPYAHAFGHDANLSGLVPEGQQVAAHLVLTLDTTDPRLSFLPADVGPRLRLVHPFLFEGIGNAAYRHDGPDRIHFIPQIGFPNSKIAADWPCEGFPDVLAPRPIELIKIKRRPRIPHLHSIFIGRLLPTLQCYRGQVCAACRARGVRLIATVPSRPSMDVRLWGETGDYVWVLFWYCRFCRAITTHNEVD